jgi:hypothetical protein
MDAVALTGAHVVAAITIKPPKLFPAVDHAVWRPTDVGEWQGVIFELVRRYSVDRPIVTHWEIGNETDIGESGGSPYLIPDAEDYFNFYRMTIPPILEAFPDAKVGGPAACWIENEPLPGFVERCRTGETPLHFISWHLYSNDPARHAAGVEKARALVADYPGQPPELMITEWSKGFDPVSIEEMAFSSRRAAITAASIMRLMEAGLDWSFYYHIWDQVCDPADFAPFFSPNGVAGMLRHWNEVPHRFGLFGVKGEVRPQYFVYAMLAQMAGERVAATSDDPEVQVLASRDERGLSVLVVNLSRPTSRDRILSLRCTHLLAGRKQLVVHRIDDERRWSSQTLELHPVEHREIVTTGEFHCQIYSPADSVSFFSLTH